MNSLRKNGLPSSCEPCRKSKLRCDHRVPVCGRCVRTKKLAKCIYRPSPSTTRTTTANPEPILLSECDPADRETGGEVNFTDRSEGQEDRTMKRRRLSQSEYMGMTSHFALFKESTSHMGMQTSIQENSGDQVTSSNAIVETSEIKEGAKILRLLRDLPVYQRLAYNWIEASYGCDLLGMTGVYSSFESLQEFSGDLSFAVLSARSREIFLLFSKPVPIHSSLTFKEYMAFMSCRWEIIGMAFTFVAAGTFFSREWDSIFQAHSMPIISRKDLGILALTAADTCLKFCNEAGVLNDAVSWLVQEHGWLTTLVHGDRDYRSWRAIGDVSTIVFTLGLNQPASMDEAPFWLSEMRKRLMSLAYSMDKQLATFLGRPPRVSWRFCNFSLPLDLSFNELIAEPSVRDAAISKLDSNGWNRAGSHGIYMRVVLLMGPIRESILELSLSQQVEDFEGKIVEILEQSQWAWARLPSFLRTRYHFESLSEKYDVTESMWLQLELDFIYNEFLLLRIRSKRLSEWSPDLVRVSCDIMSKVLLFTNCRIRSMNLSPEITWIISFFGLPSAGVLSLELLRWEQLSMDELNSASIAMMPFPRSKVIQDLSIFASYLQTVIQPYDGNYSICQQARGTIQRVLDLVLSPEHAQSAVPVIQTSTIASNSQPPNNTDVTDNILDFNYYITHLDNWQSELQNGLDMLYY
ncbi:hypothetical protein N7495_002857 [Penicillium taxi]|uniref:uncharacterized protein n=1 Tax=Penicillium taxi TaxID=168475 RepID=UPI002544EF7A|nr:uncharacterized protein N7495_002857 [Penicillium taxi]KAJ5902329.1 hypothetical protein N7495_002857 [Penicillium taxi]